MLAALPDRALDRDPIAELIAAGDYRSAVARCAQEHGASIGRLCMAMLGSQPDAEEVLQETLLAAHRAMAGYRGEGSVRSWLFGIARRQCARHLERRGRPAKAAHLQLVADEPASSPAQDVAAERRARVLRDALARLRPTEREALVLRYQADLSFREIAAMCGIDEAAARKRASRGLDRLRSLLDVEEME
jgi:RNA polymerase sigma-70 factor (ECF subfamily)